MRKLSRRLRAVLVCVALAPWAPPAQAQWSVLDQESTEIVATRSGENTLLYRCGEQHHVFYLSTPQRLPLIGSWPHQRAETRYRIDGRPPRQASLFLRDSDHAKPRYLFSLVLDVRGFDTQMTDMLNAVEAGRRLEIDILGEPVAFSLQGFSRSAAQLRRNCR